MEGKETLRVGKRGVGVIPASLRRTFHLSEGSVLVAEARAEGATATGADGTERRAERCYSGGNAY